MRMELGPSIGVWNGMEKYSYFFLFYIKKSILIFFWVSDWEKSKVLTSLVIQLSSRKNMMGPTAIPNGHDTRNNV